MLIEILHGVAYWVERQFDPADNSFIPGAFSFSHINLTHRNWTAAGVTIQTILWETDLQLRQRTEVVTEDDLPVLKGHVGAICPWFDAGENGKAKRATAIAEELHALIWRSPDYLSHVQSSGGET